MDNKYIVTLRPNTDWVEEMQIRVIAKNPFEAVDRIFAVLAQLSKGGTFQLSHEEVTSITLDQEKVKNV